MNNTDIENKVRKAYSDIAPDIQDQVLSYCKEQNGQILSMPNRRGGRLSRRIASIAAVLVLVLGIGFGVDLYHTGKKVEARISLDVNPSIEIDVNKKEKVLDVRGLNEDGITVIGGMDFEGSSLEVAVNALIGSMLRNGYLSEAANSILISVDDQDVETGKTIQHKLLEEVNQILESSSLSGAVLSQTVKQDTDLNELAGQYGITVGKAQLIRQILAKNNIYSFEQLAPLTINQLNLISGSQDLQLDDMENVGTASEKNYIGAETAKKTALEHAKLTQQQVDHLYAKMDLDDGQMIYEVEFLYQGMEYEYEIDAKSGSILELEKEKDEHFDWDDADDDDDDDPGWRGSDDDDDAPDDGEGYIGEAAAIGIALEHAGYTGEDDPWCKVKMEIENGIAIYEVEFEVPGYEYEYEIDAITGEILDIEQDLAY